jgi:hypothetical protein
MTATDIGSNAKGFGTFICDLNTHNFAEGAAIHDAVTEPGKWANNGQCGALLVRPRVVIQIRLHDRTIFLLA